MSRRRRRGHGRYLLGLSLLAAPGCATLDTGTFAQQTVPAETPQIGAVGGGAPQQHTARCALSGNEPQLHESAAPRPGAEIAQASAVELAQPLGSAGSGGVAPVRVAA